MIKKRGVSGTTHEARMMTLEERQYLNYYFFTAMKMMTSHSPGEHDVC